jgi:hypothetical protein
MAEATAIILNPKGNHSRDGRQWMAAQRACLRELAPAEVTVVESPQEAAQAAHQSALQGCRKIVTVGDSRTAYGVVNGIMELAESHRAQLRVGFLSLSRPDLWSRTLELPRSLSRQLQILSAGHTLPFDVGRVDCQRPEGGEITRHFLNGASFGVTGHLKREWRNPETNLLQTLPRLAEALRDATSPRGPRVRLTPIRPMGCWSWPGWVASLGGSLRSGWPGCGWGPCGRTPRGCAGRAWSACGPSPWMARSTWRWTASPSGACPPPSAWCRAPCP